VRERGNLRRKRGEESTQNTCCEFRRAFVPVKEKGEKGEEICKEEEGKSQEGRKKGKGAK